jgi:hypothetical protein
MQNNNKIEDIGVTIGLTEFREKLKTIIERIENEEVSLICSKYISKDDDINSNNMFLVWEINEFDELTYISSNVKMILNYNSEEMLFKRIYDFMPPDDKDLFMRELGKIKINGSKKFQLKSIFLRKNYKYTILESFGSLVFDGNNKINGLQGISIVPIE